MAPGVPLGGLLASRGEIDGPGFRWICNSEALDRKRLLFRSRGREVHAVARRRRDEFPQVVGSLDAVEDEAGVPVERRFADRGQDIDTVFTAVEAEEDAAMNDAVLPGGHCLVVDRELEGYVGAKTGFMLREQRGCGLEDPEGDERYEDSGAIHNRLLFRFTEHAPGRLPELRPAEEEGLLSSGKSRMGGKRRHAGREK